MCKVKKKARMCQFVDFAAVSVPHQTQPLYQANLILIFSLMDEAITKAGGVTMRSDYL